MEDADLGRCPESGCNSPQDGLVWEENVDILTNPTVLGQLAAALGGTGLLMFLLLSFLLAVQGEWGEIPKMLLVTLLTVGGLALLMLLVVTLFLGGCIRTRFGISEQGVLFETVDRRARGAGRLAALLGVLGGNPAAAGAGMIAASGEREHIAWRAIAGASYYPRRRTITLRNGWRTVAFLVCTPDNYEQVAAFVRQRVAARRTRAARIRRNPLPSLLGRSALVVLASLPVFLLPYPFEQDLLLPLLMLCFALATVWLVPLFGWVVVACAFALAARVIYAGLTVRDSLVGSLTYRTFEILDGDEWLALALAGLGLAFLVAYGVQAARGRIPSGLSEDYAEMEG